VLDVHVIEDRAAAAVALDPVKSRLLAELGAPASAATLAARLGLPRQKINYHLRLLEEHGLAREAERRRWGGITERLFVASAASYVVDAGEIGPDARGHEKRRDALSASYLVAIAARVVREVGALVKRAHDEEKRLATLSIDAEIRFRSAKERAAFSAELASAVNALVARYHDEHAEGGRPHRLVVVAHPFPQSDTEEKK
jgi:DNA-binding transcriptional ArsR family regulator